MAAQVQRKLEFPVRKSSRTRKAKAPTSENVAVAQVNGSPRKRLSDDEELRVKPITCSPSKKTKENIPSASNKRAETPIRSRRKIVCPDSLKYSVTDDLKKLSVMSPQRRKENTPVKNICVLSPRKQKENTPVKISSVLSPRKQENTPVKGTSVLSPRKQKENTPVKGTSVLSPRKQKENTPVKRSPCSLKLQRPDSEAYQKTKQSLHTAKPERMVCREKESGQIQSFLQGHLSNKTSGSLYISGAPGTGKTAALMHIIDDLQKHHPCKTVYLNCMTLKDSATVYGKLYTDITGKSAPSTASNRQKAVEKCLSSSGPSIILVLDEVDQLDSKNQEILYTIFEWPALTKSRLILTGIANALDLTDRILPRLQARPKCKPELLNFAPYTKNQIAAVLQDRLQQLEKDGLSVMDASAIQFCARKVSAVAGDMRKALDVCRRAVEMVETSVKSQHVLKLSSTDCNSPTKRSPQVPKKIGVLHISRVLSDVYGCSTAAQQQETIPLQQKLVVCSLLLVVKQGKMKEVTAGKLHETYCKVCKSRQMDGVDQSEFLSICNLLEARAILGLKKAKDARAMKITLKLDERELEHTLQDKVLMSSILHAGIPK